MKKTIALVSALAVVFCCSFPAFARVYPQNIITSTFSNLDTGGSSNITAYQLYGELSVYDYEGPTTNGSSSSAQQTYSGGSQDIVITGYIRNDTYTPMFCSNVTITLTDSQGSTIKNMNGFQYLYGDLLPQLSASGNTFTLVPQDYIAFEQGFIVAPMKTVYFAFTVSTTYVVTGTSVNTTLTGISGNIGWSGHSDVWEGHYGYTVNYEPMMKKLDELLSSDDGTLTIYDIVSELKESFDSNASSASDVTNQAQSNSSTIDNQHQTESNYFSDSQSAIQDTGIQNFQFSPQEMGGLNGLKDDFTAVWVSCGTLSRVWITSLTIGLALAIIRHRRMFQK